MKIVDWIRAFRLQTLPLAFSCILMGGAFSFQAGEFNYQILIWCFITTLLLQVLSNLANDYGDAEKGTDNANRLGPTRAIQSGTISMQQMKVAVVICALLAFTSGIVLLWISFESISYVFLLFLLLGAAAIGAAIKYTVGKKAFAYTGLGDVFVFIFFGLVGVLGSSFLQMGEVRWSAILLAIAVGNLSAGVLNLNNLRDYENDKACGKNTLVVQNGIKWGQRYQVVLVVSALLATLIYVVWFGKPLNWLILLSFPIFLLNLRTVLSYTNAKTLIPKLKQLALATFLLSLILFITTIV